MTTISTRIDAARLRLALLQQRGTTRALQAVLTAFLVTRLMIVLIIFASSSVIPMRSGPYLYASPDNLVLDGLVRDDSWWYISIAENGYAADDPGQQLQGNLAFFPLYPLLIRLVMSMIGSSFLAGVLVSNVALFIMLWLLYQLAEQLYDHETAARAVLYLAAAPTSVFFSAVYTESVFIALVCATFRFALLRRWQAAALVGALAAATRNTGILLAAVIAIEGFTQQGGRLTPSDRWVGSVVKTGRHWFNHLRQQLRPARASWRSLLAGACVALGTLSYMAFLSNGFGDPLAFIHAQANWGRATSAAGITKLFSTVMTNLNLGPQPLAGQINITTLMNILATLTFLPLVLTVCQKLPATYGVFTVLTFAIPLSTGTVGSMSRYILMLVPCFLLLAHWGRHQLVDRLVLGISLPLLGYFTIIFSHWYFAG